MPRDLQHILGKSSLVEKIADVQERSEEQRLASLNRGMQQEHDRRAATVTEPEQAAERQAIDPKQERERKRKEREKKLRQQEIAKRIRRDTGHIVDLEA
jgi:hypothetical protein